MNQSQKAGIPLQELKQHPDECHKDPPQQTFANFTQALAGALQQRRANKPKSIGLAAAKT